MSKVNRAVMEPWIAKRVTELLGLEDEVLINFIYGLLEGKVGPAPSYPLPSRAGAGPLVLLAQGPLCCWHRRRRSCSSCTLLRRPSVPGSIPCAVGRMTLFRRPVACGLVSLVLCGCRRWTGGRSRSS